MTGLKESWIVVTTCSQQTTRILGDELVHELKGLSEKDSWHLFERTAFGEGHKQVNAANLVKIVKRCASVLLAIKVVGSLLYGHIKEKWVSFQKKGLGLPKYGEGDGNEPILKLSIQWSFTRNKIRTFLCLCIGYWEQYVPVAKLLKHWMCLRALDLRDLRSKSDPSALGKLLHLKYLDLSHNSELETLANSVTKLHNIELPESLPKLVKLRVLDLGIHPFYCQINSIPRGVGKLSCFQQLFLFVVGDNNMITEQKDLQPHPKLRELELSYYMGRRMPSWTREDKSAIALPNLVKNVMHCNTCLPLEKKFLRLSFLKDLDCIQNTTTRANISDGAGTSEADAFFPSLERLQLSCMTKLKGWWRDEEISNSNGKDGHRLLPSFPHLIELTIERCPNLTCIPPCPVREELELRGGSNGNLRMMITSESGNSKLRCAKTSNVR
ncbi:hypothetical protein Cgig2_018012 [Carnegiea gigantea]|uniref:R13L1/DRL21-like LRR repeat region domain-containing protein n=1 Tax=Carnegiea gigantea TaxID=171969 RepID=A0A9Q1JJU0_9CARY|nr:hypothetical protein Cgig2_018012 [Carnegiea gigantea]